MSTFFIVLVRELSLYIYIFLLLLLLLLSFFLVVERSKAKVYGRSPTAIVVSNPTGDMDVCLLCVDRWRSLRRAVYSSRGVLPTAARRCV
jgi:1-acyl-sn-glycerol-3-phosphate acyltransferase